MGILGQIAGYLVLPIVFPSAYFDSVPVYGIVVIGFIFHAFFSVFHLDLIQAEKTIGIAVASTTAVVLNILLNIILIPSFGILGAAWATVLSYAVEAIVVLLFAIRLGGGDYVWSLLGAALIAAVCQTLYLANVDSAKPFFGRRCLGNRLLWNVNGHCLGSGRLEKKSMPSMIESARSVRQRSTAGLIPNFLAKCKNVAANCGGLNLRGRRFAGHLRDAVDERRHVEIMHSLILPNGVRKTTNHAQPRSDRQFRSTASMFSSQVQSA